MGETLTVKNHNILLRNITIVNTKCTVLNALLGGEDIVVFLPIFAHKGVQKTGLSHASLADNGDNLYRGAWKILSNKLKLCAVKLDKRL